MKLSDPPPMCSIPEWLMMTDVEREEYSRLRMQKLRAFGQESLEILAKLYQKPGEQSAVGASVQESLSDR
jgi:hypothetical protein